MSANLFNLPCPECGQFIEVSPRQSGQSVVCPHCNATTEAPRLGVMKQLDPVGKPAVNASAGVRPASNGVFVAGLFLLVLGLVAGISLNYYANQLIIDYNVEGGMDRLDPYVDELTPAQVALLFDQMNVDAGLGDWKEQPYVAQTKQGQILKLIAYAFYGLSGIGLIMMLFGLFKSSPA
ncbi:MAG: hypothetical protein AAFN77_17200 [Planctomycetota bacterium]